MSTHPITEKLLNGTLIREPVGNEQGYWSGAPGWTWDETDQAAYVCYRIRRPRGVEPDRGGESRIAKTTDFKNFADVWSVQKSDYNSAGLMPSDGAKSHILSAPFIPLPHMEVCSTNTGRVGLYQYFVTLRRRNWMFNQFETIALRSDLCPSQHH